MPNQSFIDKVYQKSPAGQLPKEEPKVPQQTSFIDRLPVVKTSRTMTPLERASSSSFIDKVSPMRQIQPKQVDVKPDAVVEITEHPKGPDYTNWTVEDLDQIVRSETRKKARFVKNTLGDGVAKFLYGEDIVNEIPDRPVPAEYKDSYVKDGKWYIPGRGEVPPPPTEFMEGVPEKSLSEKGLEWLIPQPMWDLSKGEESVEFQDWGEVLRSLFFGPHYEREQAGQALLMGMAQLPLYTEFLPTKMDEGQWELTKQGLKAMFDKGVFAPRLIGKALARTDGKLFLPIREKGWELVSFPLRKRWVPTYEGAKSVKEIFQPAIERIDDSLSKPMRAAAAKKQLIAKAGQRLGAKVKELDHIERFEFAKAMRGERSSNAKVQGIVDEFKSNLKSYKLDDQYKTSFFNELDRLMKEQEFTYGLDDSFPAVKEFFDEFAKDGTERSFRQTQKALKGMWRHPFVSNEVKALVRDLYNIPAATPDAVASAAKHASKQAVVDAVKNSPYAKIALEAGDNAKDWLQHGVKKGTSMSYFGKDMAGLWIHRDVELELRAMMKIPDIAKGTFAKWFMTPWKTGKIILRPATHFRNIVSNAILNDWGGMSALSPDSWHSYYKALQGMRKGSKEWKLFQRLSGAGGTFSSAEAAQLEKGLRIDSNMFDRTLALFDRVVAPAREFYNAEEQMFKFGKFLHNLKRGMGEEAAALDAMKWTFNYNEITRATAMVRGNLAPFFTWQSKVIPLMAETAVQHPWRLAKWYLMYEMMQHHALDALNMSDREYEDFQTILPEYVKEAQVLMLPRRDDEGRFQLLNLTYMIPGFGDLSELLAHPAGELLGNPLITIGGSILTRRKWSGAPLYYDWEPPGTKAAKTMSYVWQQLAPPTAPGGADWNSIYRTITDQEGAPTAEQQIASNLGFKIIPIDEGKARRSRRALDNMHRAEITTQMRRELRKAKSTSQRAKIIEKYNRLRREIGMQ